MNKPTPRPWKLDTDLCITSEIHGDIASMKEVTSFHNEEMEPFDNHEANAAHIIKCVNEHDGLVVACKAAIARFQHFKMGEHGICKQLESALAEHAEVAG